MKDPEHAHLLLEMARRDLTALSNMTDRNRFADEIFGFHAQQAVEKALKCRLSEQGIAYPRTHDIEYLIDCLEKNGVGIPSANELVDLNDFAVQYRYEAFDNLEGTLDREAVVMKITALLEEIAKSVNNPA